MLLVLFGETRSSLYRETMLLLSPPAEECGRCMVLIG
eukprot:COSAG01_NODE_20168_length_967_cov_1.164747_2_plen_36_part_01